VVDTQHEYAMLVVIDLVHHSVGTTTGGVEPSKFALQTSSDAMWVLDECGERELDDRRCGALGQSAQLLLSGAGESRLVGVCVVAHVALNRARSSSPGT
jgi:hypothetical protein